LNALDRRRLVDTSANVVDKLIPFDDSVKHQHGPEGEHSHQGTAFTTWLDPQLAIAQAKVLTNALIDLAPTSETQFLANSGIVSVAFHTVANRPEEGDFLSVMRDNVERLHRSLR